MLPLQVQSLYSLPTVVYDPKTFILHAVLLRQAFAHCAIFPTAASRRSVGRVSVPLWLVILSDQLRIVALVGHYPTNKLIRHRPIPYRNSLMTSISTRHLCGISTSFPVLSPSEGHVTYALLSRPPLKYPRKGLFARLACIKHTASVRPEP